jgi:hypothetical protein
MDPKDDAEFKDIGYLSEPITVEFTLAEVDPEVLALLTGVRPDGERPVHQSMEVWGEHKRKWWEWLLRRPRRRYHYYLPNVKIEPTGFQKPDSESE